MTVVTKMIWVRSHPKLLLSTTSTQQALIFMCLSLDLQAQVFCWEVD